jgi:hypothetical protein
MITHFVCSKIMIVGPRTWKIAQNLWENLRTSIYVRETACQSTSNMMKTLLCLELSIRTKRSYALLLYKRANQSLSHLLIDSNGRMTTKDMCVLYYALCKPSNDNVKVAVEYDTGDKIHFAKCVVFLQDSMGEYFVLLQWYDQVGRQPLDSVSGLVQLVLRPPNVTRSYSIMPITSIVNGAIITCSEKKLWVLLSQRETFAYELTNT